ncbi:hypothetical protein RUM43_012098 [Polyplax serrata]|uniref:Uncharacterized protein n=1 Tax=Polyplax serrata TaxID=468196 RepID=A0AAN8S7K0_POLSC
MFVSKLQFLVQLKFLGVATINMLANVFRLWIELKKKHKPSKVVFYENAHHQHHYDHEHLIDHEDGHFGHPASHGQLGAIVFGKFSSVNRPRANVLIIKPRLLPFVSSFKPNDIPFGHHEEEDYGGGPWPWSRSYEKPSAQSSQKPSGPYKYKPGYNYYYNERNLS